MNSSEAREILGLPDDATFEDIRAKYRSLARRYHPDVPDTGDSNRFVLINTAYMYLQATDLGISDAGDVPAEVADATALRGAIIDYFDDILREFQILREHIEESVEDYVWDVIESTDSTDELRKAVEGRVAQHLVETKAVVENFLKTTYSKAVRNKNDFLFNLFDDMYAARRDYWLTNMYRNPIFLADLGGVAGIFLARNFDPLQSIAPALWSLISLWWLPFLVLMIGAGALVYQYYKLSPRRQFVPPRLSIANLHTFVSENANQIQVSKGELAGGLGTLGAIIGTIALPFIGTLIGGAAGALLGAVFGKDFDETKRKVFSQIYDNFENAMQQIEESIEKWVNRSKDELYEAAIESFSQNCLQLARIVGNKELPISEVNKRVLLLED